MLEPDWQRSFSIPASNFLWIFQSPIAGRVPWDIAVPSCPKPSNGGGVGRRPLENIISCETQCYIIHNNIIQALFWPVLSFPPGVVYLKTTHLEYNLYFDQCCRSLRDFLILTNILLHWKDAPGHARWSNSQPENSVLDRFREKSHRRSHPPVIPSSHLPINLSSHHLIISSHPISHLISSLTSHLIMSSHLISSHLSSHLISCHLISSSLGGNANAVCPNLH